MSADQRKFLRKSLEVRFRALAPGHDGAVAGHLSFDSVDLSAGGPFLRSDLLLEQGEALSLEFALDGRLIKAQAHVAWVRRFPVQHEPAGMGVEFVSMHDADRRLLERYLER
jgi:uncharacterized protein (TIGR02266 family)